MEIYTDEFESKIELKIKDLLDGKSLLNWCREISDQFVCQTDQTFPPFSLAKFLPFRRIKAIHDRKISITGKIEKIETGFLLKLNPDKLSSRTYYNFVLAHEIAHTFFYDTTNLQPVEVSGLSPGSSHLEYLCNKIARYLLVPSKSIESDLSRLPQFDRLDFSLECVNDLVEKYRTSHYTMLTRIIVDEPLWKVLLLRFKYFEETENWKLVESYKPKHLNSFIPTGNGKWGGKDPTKYPTAKNKLDKFLRAMNDELDQNKRVTKRLPVKDFYGEPLGNLLSHFDKNQEVTLHSSLHKKEKTINLLIPL